MVIKLTRFFEKYLGIFFFSTISWFLVLLCSGTFWLILGPLSLFIMLYLAPIVAGLVAVYFARWSTFPILLISMVLSVFVVSYLINGYIVELSLIRDNILLVIMGVLSGLFISEIKRIWKQKHN